MGYAPLAKSDPAATSSGPRLAYVKYELVRTYVAAVAEVEVNRSTGAIRVTKFFVAHDCGQIINPDGSQEPDRRQHHPDDQPNAEGRGQVRPLGGDQPRLGSYPILTFPEVPEIVIDLIDRPDELPWGGGEPSAAVVPSAISTPCSMRPVCGCVRCRSRPRR